MRRFIISHQSEIMDVISETIEPFVRMEMKVQRTFRKNLHKGNVIVLNENKKLSMNSSNWFVIDKNELKKHIMTPIQSGGIQSYGGDYYDTSSCLGIVFFSLYNFY